MAYSSARRANPNSSVHHRTSSSPNSGEVHHGQGADEEGFGDEVPVGDGVEGVLEPGREPEVVGGRVGVEGQAGPGERAGPEGRDGGAVEGVVPPVDVAGQGPDVREEVMGEEDRLGSLEVRVAGQVGVAGFRGALDEGGLQGVQLAGEGVALAAQVEAQVGGDLVVAAASGGQLGADLAGELGHAPFDGGVDVLVARREREGVVGEFGFDGVEGGEDGRDVLGHQDAAGPEHADVGA